MPPIAKSILYSMCEHGTATIDLLDDKGNVIAIAALPLFNAVKLSEAIARDAAKLAETVDTIGECKGHA
jgi:hypothetical protein